MKKKTRYSIHEQSVIVRKKITKILQHIHTLYMHIVHENTSYICYSDLTWRLLSNQLDKGPEWEPLNDQIVKQSSFKP